MLCNLGILKKDGRRVEDISIDGKYFFENLLNGDAKEIVIENIRTVTRGVYFSQKGKKTYIILYDGVILINDPEKFEVLFEDIKASEKNEYYIYNKDRYKFVECIKSKFLVLKNIRNNRATIIYR